MSQLNDIGTMFTLYIIKPLAKNNFPVYSENNICLTELHVLAP